MSAESTPSSPRSEHLSEAVKARAFEALVQAWDDLEEARTCEAQRLWEPALAALGRSLREAARALAILHSASAKAFAELGLLRHLIESDRHFRSCSWKELEALWNRTAAAVQEGSWVADDPDRANRVLENFLEAAEGYHFFMKRRLYYTYREHGRGRTRRNLLLSALGSIGLIPAVLYGLYAYWEPARAEVEHGQAFWMSPDATEELESNSVRFRVEADGTFRDYKLSLEERTGMEFLRLDPVTKPDAEIWIERLEIYQQGASPTILRFHELGNLLDANPDIGPISIEDGTLHFRTLGADPRLRFLALKQHNVEAIMVRMKVSFPVGFREWLYERIPVEPAPEQGDHEILPPEVPAPATSARLDPADYGHYDGGTCVDGSTGMTDRCIRRNTGRPASVTVIETAHLLRPPSVFCSPSEQDAIGTSSAGMAS